jgi:hypothetical protein
MDGGSGRASEVGKWMNFHVVVVLTMAVLATACARPGRELKAPCGPISSYAANNECGELKPLNSSFENVTSE